MTDEVKGAEVDLVAQLETERIARQEAEDRLASTSVERDNYKTVALKRKGKLEDDEKFFGDNDEADVERIVADKVKQTQSERENARRIEKAEAEARAANEKLTEIIRAQDNKPAGVIGTSAGGGQVVADGIFSQAQEAAMKQRWTIRGYSEEAQTRMLEVEKKNALSRRNL